MGQITKWLGFWFHGTRLKPLLLALTYLRKVLSNLCHLLDPTRDPEGGKQAHDQDNSALLVIILGSLVAVLSAALLILCVCFLSWRKKQRKGNLLSQLKCITCQPGAADICITVVFRNVLCLFLVFARILKNEVFCYKLVIYVLFFSYTTKDFNCMITLAS